jgi:hypothetical protein
MRARIPAVAIGLLAGLISVSHPAGAEPGLPTGPVRVPAQLALDSGLNRLVDVRAGRHPSFDRVVFEFNHALPGATVQYRTVRTQGRGNELPLLGRVFLAVDFTGADAHDDNGEPSFAQTGGMMLNFPTLTQVGFAGDFESHVTFGLGLSARAGFRVVTLANPPRLVIDLAHPARAPGRVRPTRHALISCGQPELRARDVSCSLAIKVVDDYDRAIRAAEGVPGSRPVAVRSLSCTGVPLGSRDGYMAFRINCRNGNRLVTFRWE